MKPASLGIVQNVKNQVLLVLRADVKLWVLPGGGIDPGENPEEACRREILEEASIRIDEARLSRILRTQSKIAADTYLFLCTTNNPTPHFDKKETIDAQFFDLHSLPNKLFFLHKKWLLECLNQPQCIERPLCEVTIPRSLHYMLAHPLQTARYLITRTCGKISGT